MQDLEKLIDELLKRELRPNTRDDLAAWRKEVAAGTLAADDAPAPSSGEIDRLRADLAAARERETALAAERDRLQVVCDQTGSPTPARWIGAATALILARTQNGTPWRSGTVHLAASGQTTWHGFAEAIFEDALAAGLIDHAPFVEAIPTQAWPTPAQRPAYSCLDTRVLRERFGVTLPDWRLGVSQVIGELAR